MFSRISVLSVLFSSLVSSSCVWNTLDGNPSRLVGHRGEKAFMPEHSLGSYHMAAFESVDYIEPDVVVTKDQVLVVLHNEWLSDTTNVASIPKFADRKRSYLYEGKYTKINRTDYFVFDFTYAELQEIYQVQAPNFPYRPQYFNRDFHIMSLDTYLDQVQNLTTVFNRTYGVIPELKSPELFNYLNPSSNGRWFEDSLLSTFEKRGFFANQPPSRSPLQIEGDLLNSVLNIKPASYQAPNYKLAAIQSFDPDTCKYIASKTKIPVVALDSTKPTWYTPKGLDTLATFSKILSPYKDIMVAGPEAFFDLTKISYNKTEIASLGGFLQPKDLVRECHKRGIELSPYTFYDSRQASGLLCTSSNDTRLTWCPKNKKEELKYFFELGTDYLFVENIFEAQMLRLAHDFKTRYGIDY
ncbi:Glycerophosphodiester phosphodiesterase GDPD5 [Smittium mucronatum]|uniref:glycerophosphodiester phosphodiesterase n=1 Tax=Smittium mucronatum TaxID=133383 RepID=A0A1R0H060_9FUNG|nr:Glycerophosphodiester phosphodiesterase GDPD5 [Smittium mucronatum]